MAVAEFESNDRKLRQTLSLSQLTLLSLGAIVGSGWLFAALGANTSTGGSAVLSWVIGGILVLFVALTYAEVAAMLPRSGAIVRYPHLTHGGYTGFILGWAYLLASCSVPAIEAIATVQYLAPHVPASWHLLQDNATHKSLLNFPEGFFFTLVLMLLFFAINVYGARFLGRFNNTVMVWKLGIPILTFIFLFALSFNGSNFTAGGGFTPFGLQTVFSVIPGAGIVFSYLGFRQALDYGGESRRPQRDIPLATVLSVLIGTVIYVLLQLAFTGGISWAGLHLKVGDWTALGNLPVAASSPFYAILKSSGIGFLGAFASVLLADAVISPAGTGYIYLGTGGRTVFGLGVSNYLPAQTKSVGRRGVPWVALVASLVVGILFTIPTKSWYGLVNFITSATVFTYIMGGIGTKVMRRTAPGLSRPFHLPLVDFWAPLGFLSAVAIVFWSGFATDAAVMAAIFIGLPLFAWFYMVKQGYTPKVPSYVLGAVFLGCWFALQWWGHWVLSSRDAANAALHAPFPEWDILCAAAVFGFSGLLWLLSNAQGKKIVGRSWWLLCLMFGEVSLARYSSFGPNPKAVVPHFLQFPYDTIWALLFGLVIFYWAVHSGYKTDEMEAILETGSGLIEPEQMAEERSRSRRPLTRPDTVSR